jgi:hypothetical protein
MLLNKKQKTIVARGYPSTSSSSLIRLYVAMRVWCQIVAKLAILSSHNVNFNNQNSNRLLYPKSMQLSVMLLATEQNPEYDKFSFLFNCIILSDCQFAILSMAAEIKPKLQNKTISKTKSNQKHYSSCARKTNIYFGINYIDSGTIVSSKNSSEQDQMFGSRLLDYYRMFANNICQTITILYVNIQLILNNLKRSTI